MAALNALKALGYLKADSDEFDLVETLRITKSKARSLLYQTALRTYESEAVVNDALRKALATTQVVREGVLYLIEVPDPLTMDRLRKRVRNYGFLSDGTFSGPVAKIPAGALLKLVEDLIPDDQKAGIKKGFIEAGMPDKTIAGALKAMFAVAGKKVAGDAGDQAAKAIGEEIGEILKRGWDGLRGYAGSNNGYEAKNE